MGCRTGKNAYMCHKEKLSIDAISVPGLEKSIPAHVEKGDVPSLPAKDKMAGDSSEHDSGSWASLVMGWLRRAHTFVLKEVRIAALTCENSL